MVRHKYSYDSCTPLRLHSSSICSIQMPQKRPLHHRQSNAKRMRRNRSQEMESQAAQRRRQSREQIRTNRALRHSSPSPSDSETDQPQTSTETMFIENQETLALPPHSSIQNTSAESQTASTDQQPTLQVPFETMVIQNKESLGVPRDSSIQNTSIQSHTEPSVPHVHPLSSPDSEINGPPHDQFPIRTSLAFTYNPSINFSRGHVGSMTTVRKYCQSNLPQCAVPSEKSAFHLFFLLLNRYSTF